MESEKDAPKFVDPLPQEYYDSVDRFRRNVIDRASEIPPDEYKRLVAEERERQWPYMQVYSKALFEHIGAQLGIDPEEFKQPPEPPGFLKKYFEPGFDSVAAVRAIRGHDA